jgi:type II secretion system protein N
MTQTALKKGWIYTGVLLTAVIAAVFFLFPCDRLATYITSSLTESSRNAVFTCNGSRLHFPPGLVLNQFRVDFKHRQGARIDADSLALQPRLLDLIRGRLSMLLKADTYGGSMDGDIAFIRYFAAQGPLRAKLNFSEIDLQRCSYLSTIFGMPLKGRFKGTFDYTGDSNELLKGTGQAHFTIREGHFQTAGSTAGILNAFSFDSMEAEIALEEGKLKIGKLLLGGKNVQSILKGYVFLREDLGASEISLSGKMELPAPLTKLDFTVTGTVSRPIITVM